MQAWECWALTEGHAGMENQCVGLAEALGLDPRRVHVAPSRPWSALPASWWWWRALRPAVCGARLEPPWPRLLVSCGRRSVATAMAIRHASGGATVAVHVQDPYVAPARFDLVIAPRHDRLGGANVIVTRGALHRITPERLRAARARGDARLAHLPRPLVGVLVGGPSRRQALPPAVVRDLVARLRAACVEHGAGLAITPSRRTGADNERALRDALTGLPAWVWDGSGENPYEAVLALADALVVTADSVSMVSEACSTGTPVYVFELEGGSARLRAFHAGLRADGITRPFTGALERWEYAPLADTPEAARAVRRLLDADGGDAAYHARRAPAGAGRPGPGSEPPRLASRGSGGGAPEPSPSKARR